MNGTMAADDAQAAASPGERAAAKASARTRSARPSAPTIPLGLGDEERDLDLPVDEGAPWCVELAGGLEALSTVELWGALADGSVPLGARVWRDGMECWTAAGEIPELAWVLRDPGSVPRCARRTLGPGVAPSRSELPAAAPETFETPVAAWIAARKTASEPQPAGRILGAGSRLRAGTSAFALAFAGALLVACIALEGAPRRSPATLAVAVTPLAPRLAAEAAASALSHARAGSSAARPALEGRQRRVPGGGNAQDQGQRRLRRGR